ncbi:hypothetical protein SAMN05216338_104764 [Bradyrhizobium sp. Rc2d]|nr:hypothetical protein SAMN05216338_104764 [Bradyrhizobium sp. Rc2d]
MSLNVPIEHRGGLQIASARPVGAFAAAPFSAGSVFFRPADFGCLAPPSLRRRAADHGRATESHKSASQFKVLPNVSPSSVGKQGPKFDTLRIDRKDPRHHSTPRPMAPLVDAARDAKSAIRRSFEIIGDTPGRQIKQGDHCATSYLGIVAAARIRRRPARSLPPLQAFQLRALVVWRRRWVSFAADRGSEDKRQTSQVLLRKFRQR